MEGMEAWLLVIWLGTQNFIPGIESETQCKQLAHKIVPKPSADDPLTFKCIRYRIAVPPRR